MSDFMSAYVTCALWSSTDESNEQGGEPLDKNYSSEDIAPEALARMQRDCESFETIAASLLAQAYGHHGYDVSYAGHDFWLTRNGHGAGFWDRGLGAVGEALSTAARAFGECDLYVGDDGKLYI